MHIVKPETWIQWSHRDARVIARFALPLAHVVTPFYRVVEKDIRADVWGRIKGQTPSAAAGEVTFLHLASLAIRHGH